MTTTNTEPKPSHEHDYYPTEVYRLSNFWYLIVKLVCECGDEQWDIGEKLDSDKLP